MSNTQKPFSKEFKKLEEAEEGIDQLVKIIYKHYPDFRLKLSDASGLYKTIHHKAPRVLRFLFLGLYELLRVIENGIDPSALIQGPIKDTAKDIEDLLTDIIRYNDLLLNIQTVLKEQPAPSLPNNEPSDFHLVSKVIFDSVSFELSVVGITLFFFKIIFTILEMKKNGKSKEEIDRHWREQLENSEQIFTKNEEDQDAFNTISRMANDLRLLTIKGASQDICELNLGHLLELSKSLLGQIFEASRGKSKLFNIKWEISDLIIIEKLNLATATPKKQAQEVNWESINVSQWLLENGFEGLVGIAENNQWQGSSLRALYNSYNGNSSNLSFICEELGIPKGAVRVSLLEKIKEKFST